MSSADFVLNTSSMDDAADGCQKLAEKMRGIKQELTSSKDSLIFYWEGKGCNEFEKQYRLLLQQLSDITDNLWETAEKILSAEEAYIQTDTDAAKALDGVTKGEVTRADDQVTNMDIY